MAHDSNDEVEVGDVDYSHRERVRGTQTGFQTGGIYDDVAGFFDHAAGSVDEAIGRQFDDEAGGGLIDGFLSATPFLSQAQSTTERQIEQGIIEEPDGWNSDTQQTQSEDGNTRDFERSGTPTTDGSNQSAESEQQSPMPQGENLKALVIAGGAVTVGGYAMTKVGGSDDEKSDPSTGQNTARERRAEVSSNRDSNGN